MPGKFGSQALHDNIHHMVQLSLMSRGQRLSVDGDVVRFLSVGPFDVPNTGDADG
ncbi:Uncharacterised protein [Mycobacteroides abscessus subsp. bolletii]|nr:Uncharacterised protein [Mycobacteroides abscessus subsp. bolletii]